MSMSWLWGGDKNKPKVPEDFKDFVPPTTGGGAGGGDDSGSAGGGNLGGAMEAYRFDSSALERAAKAARDLEHQSEY